MAWTLVYASERIGALGDDSYEGIRGQIDTINRTGGAGWIHIETSRTKLEILYTPGVPLYFAYFNENAEAPVENGLPVQTNYDLG